MKVVVFVPIICPTICSRSLVAIPFRTWGLFRIFKRANWWVYYNNNRDEIEIFAINLINCSTNEYSVLFRVLKILLFHPRWPFSSFAIHQLKYLSLSTFSLLCQPNPLAYMHVLFWSLHRFLLYLDFHSPYSENRLECSLDRQNGQSNHIQRIGSSQGWGHQGEMVCWRVMKIGHQRWDVLLDVSTNYCSGWGYKLWRVKEEDIRRNHVNRWNRGPKSMIRQKIGTDVLSRLGVQ